MHHAPTVALMDYCCTIHPMTPLLMHYGLPVVQYLPLIHTCILSTTDASCACGTGTYGLPPHHPLTDALWPSGLMHHAPVVWYLPLMHHLCITSSPSIISQPQIPVKDASLSKGKTFHWHSLIIPTDALYAVVNYLYLAIDLKTACNMHYTLENHVLWLYFPILNCL